VSVMSTGWREFDDSKVREITESCITTKAAYVLFYRQRHAPTSVTPASLPAGISAPMPSSTSETSAVPPSTAAHQDDHSQTTATANRKTVAALPAEFVAPVWQTDMEAID